MGQQQSVSDVFEQLLGEVLRAVQSERIKEELQEWIQSSNSINIFVMGKTGAGKSMARLHKIHSKNILRIDGSMQDQETEEMHILHRQSHPTSLLDCFLQGVHACLCCRSAHAVIGNNMV